MNFIFQCIMALVRFTILIGLAGGLVDMTRTMGQEAIKAHRTGFVSLGELNRSLVGNPTTSGKRRTK